MKYSILTLLLLVSALQVKAQYTANILTQNEFNNIKINNVTLEDIKNTNGNKSQIEALLGSSTRHQINEDGNSFTYNGLDLSFSTIISGASYSNSILGRFEISTNDVNITVNGITLKIGDPISLLSNIDININKDGSKSILYEPCDGCNSFISIDFDQQTNLITKIIYIELT